LKEDRETGRRMEKTVPRVASQFLRIAKYNIISIIKIKKMKWAWQTTIRRRAQDGKFVYISERLEKRNQINIRSRT